MNTKSSPGASLSMSKVFDGALEPFDSPNNDAESEFYVEEKHLPIGRKGEMRLYLYRKLSLKHHPSCPKGLSLLEQWILEAAGYGSSSKTRLVVEDFVVVQALAAGASPIVAALDANPDWIASLREQFTAFNAICEKIELAAIAPAAPSLGAAEQSGL